MALRGLAHGVEEAFGCPQAHRGGRNLRRLTSKIALDLMGRKIQNVLEPIEVGVRTSHGTEGVVHAARQWMNRHSDNSNKVMVLNDIKNAFNSVDRSAVLQAVLESFSEVAPWADLCCLSFSGFFTVRPSVRFCVHVDLLLPVSGVAAAPFGTLLRPSVVLRVPDLLCLHSRLRLCQALLCWSCSARWRSLPSPLP